ncbi:alpha/beta hydrolase [Sciscionella sediminilitoris]|uniref:alpha/beta hydrolase n=1 Tax=Sciscionella sediminilitoris TaxID=1445613 RepID=UPI0004DF6042|nr:alpha/beta fold hydrolase [Sciscionella sp. SE31]
MSDNDKTSAISRDIEFTSGGVTLRGWLRRPATEGPHPLVVLGHGLGGLKEWTIPDIADALVADGIAALTFDYRNWGDSDGQPREEIDHTGRIDDWQNAISYVTTLDEIDPARIGIWGTSLGGRDVLAVAAIDSRVRCVLSQVPLIDWTPEFVAFAAGFGDDLDRYYQTLSDDRRKRALGGEPEYMPFDTPDDAPAAYVADYQAYTATWGEAELRNYRNRITLQSYAPTVLLDMTPFIERIAPKPLQMIIADQDVLPGQREAFAAAGEPKSLIELPGGHYSPYYGKNKDAAIAATRAFFAEHLTAGTR